jgi:hypothetical protein
LEEIASKVTPEHPNKIEIGCARLHHLDDKRIYLKWMKKAVYLLNAKRQIYFINLWFKRPICKQTSKA